MFKNLSAKHYLDNKERLQKKSCERNWRSLSKKEKGKSGNTV